MYLALIHSRGITGLNAVMKHKLQKNQKKLTTRWNRLILLTLNKIAFTFLFTSLLFSCLDQEQSLDERISLLKLQTLPEVTHPSNNPPTEDKIKLGKLLFYDPILSGEKNIACATCHHPTLGYADGLDLSIGPGGTGLGTNRVGAAGRPRTMRNSLTLINNAYTGLANASQALDVSTTPQTWAIVRRSQEAQTFGAMGNPTVMRGNGYTAAAMFDSLTKRLKSIDEYVTLFDNAFGGGASSITQENLGKALAVFQRSLVSNNSPYDRYAKGQLDALTEQQKAGLLLFFGKANCSNCHGGPMFSDYGLYNLGIKDHSLVNPKDKGSTAQERLFRTPQLRNVALTAPYMHNGTIATLKEVIKFYNKGVSENDSVSQDQMSIKIQPLDLSDKEEEDLVAFMEALTDQSYDQTIPERVPSGYKVGGN
jgi:cytochrome c peroxidase